MKRGMLVFGLFLLSISFINASVIFPASNVSIKIDGTDRTLQYAVDNGLLKGTHTYASADISNIIGQHDASQIWVKTGSGEMTLLSALSPTNKLSAPSSNTTSYSGVVPNPGHTAMEVILSSGQTFQQVIDSSSFAECTPGNTKKCGTDAACITYPTITCNSSGGWPACNPSYAAFGAACQDSDHACNGAGNCSGWSGTGCSSCPFGSSPLGNYYTGCYLCTAGTNTGGNGYPVCNSPLYLGSYRAPYGWTTWCNSGVSRSCWNAIQCNCHGGGCPFGGSGDLNWKIKP